jgi:MGT family glycosyltransferase
MATVLAYVEPVPGRLYPLVTTFQELARRGHRVTVRTGVDQVELLHGLGLDATPLAGELARLEPEDWRARTRFGALLAGVGQFGERAVLQVPDLQKAIEAEQPDVLLVDETSWGAAAVAERSGLPWVFCIPSPVPLPSRDAPPFGLGLAPRGAAFGGARDAVARRLALGSLARLIASHVNPLRRELGLAPMRTLGDFYLAATLLLAYTAEPFEYPRSDWPAKLRLVGPGLWEPPGDAPAWIDQAEHRVVLVNCSTLFQNDRRIVDIACEAFAGQPFEVAVTTADIDPSGFEPPPNVHIERFLPHSPVLDRASCAVCHAGMGITQKALAHGVPVVAIPFGRDQPEVARRVQAARAGVRLPVRSLRARRLLRAVNEAIELRAGARRVAERFARIDTPTVAANALEELVEAHVRPQSKSAPAEQASGQSLARTEPNPAQSSAISVGRRGAAKRRAQP